MSQDQLIAEIRRLKGRPADLLQLSYTVPTQDWNKAFFQVQKEGE